MKQEQKNYVPDKSEAAYHEAGHAVTGLMFYPPVELVSIKTEVVEGKSVRGRTVCEFPFPDLGDPSNRKIFKEYLKIIINSLSGKFCQSTVNGVMDEVGARDDYEFLDLYIFGQEYVCLQPLWNDITRDFCTNLEFMEMVSIVAKELHEKELLTGKELDLLIKDKLFDPEPLLEIMAEKYHTKYLACKKLFTI